MTIPLRILVVDDDPEVRDLLTEFLARRGHHVRAAADGSAAYAALAETPADVVLLDLYMPGDSGLEVLKRLRGDRYAGKIILLTASHDEPLLRQGLDLDISDVLGKPIDLDRLIEAITVKADRRERSRNDAGDNAAPSPDQPRACADRAPASAGPSASGQFAARTVLFTDVRNSTQLLEAYGTEAFFVTLNRHLTVQSRAVREFGGTVLKFTGDGLMASFQGADRLANAFRCARAIQTAEQEPGDMLRRVAFGQGICDGLVVRGWIGDRADLRDEMLGLPAHVASRLCSAAAAAAVMMVKKDFDRLPFREVLKAMPLLLDLKGIPEAVACVEIAE